MRERGLNTVGQLLGVNQALGLADEDLARVVAPALGQLLHLLQVARDGSALAANLLLYGQTTVGLHVHDGADLEQAAHQARGLGDAPAADEEREVAGEEPVLHLEAVLLRPGRKLVDAHAGVAQVRKPVHEQAVAGACAQGVNDYDLAVRVLLGKLVACGAGGAVGSGDAGREGHVEDVLALREELLEVGDVLADADLGGLGVRAGKHL